MPGHSRKPLTGQLLLFADARRPSDPESPAQRLARLAREEKVRAVKACFGWWNGRGRGMA